VNSTEGQRQFPGACISRSIRCISYVTPRSSTRPFFEGLVLFAILWSIRRKSPFDGFLFAAYLFGYGFFRFFIEFFREPDVQLGLVLGGIFSMGQVLCLLMMAAGILIHLFRKPRKSLA
jgi:phosphatidylglycerol:prolipoprotein diacylglycerol transferase